MKQSIKDDAIEFLLQYKGRYKVLSPYHKNKKYLPFIISGMTYDDEYPIECEVVEYRGWEKSIIVTGYQVKSLLDKINNHILIQSK